MKKTISKLLALALTASLVLSGCGGSGSSETADNQTDENSAGTESQAEENENEIKDLVIPRLATREMQTFDILYSQNFFDLENLTNMQDPLLEVDTHGKLVP